MGQSISSAAPCRLRVFNEVQQLRDYCHACMRAMSYRALFAEELQIKLRGDEQEAHCFLAEQCDERAQALYATVEELNRVLEVISRLPLHDCQQLSEIVHRWLMWHDWTLQPVTSFQNELWNIACTCGEPYKSSALNALTHIDQSELDAFFSEDGDDDEDPDDDDAQTPALGDSPLR